MICSSALEEVVCKRFCLQLCRPSRVIKTVTFAKNLLKVKIIGKRAAGGRLIKCRHIKNKHVKYAKTAGSDKT